MKERNYSYKDVDMLLASQTIAQNLQDNQAELVTVRTTWTPEYVDNLQTQVDEAITNYLGTDKKQQLKETTQQLHQVQENALKDLSLFKTQLQVDFPEETENHLTTLGFTKNYKKVQNRIQEALIELLYTFQNHMTDELRNTLTANGMNPTLIDNIIAYADNIKNLNTQQEALKESTKQLTTEAIITFNEIYTQIIGICKIASNYYPKDNPHYNQFVFSNVVANMSSGS